MKYYKIKYISGKELVVRAENSLEVIKKYDLACLANINTRVIELQGELAAIARSNDI